MQDHTQEDILIYTKEMFRAVELSHESRIDFLQWAVGYIIENAQGVFTWVKLVTHLLVEGIVHGDDDAELRELLQEVPHELNDYTHRQSIV